MGHFTSCSMEGDDFIVSGRQASRVSTISAMYLVDELPDIAVVKDSSRRAKRGRGGDA